MNEEISNNKVFESMIDELESKYKGMYVVIANGKLLSVHKSLEEALKVDKGKYNHRIIFKVSEKPEKMVRLGWRVARPAGHIRNTGQREKQSQEKF